MPFFSKEKLGCGKLDGGIRKNAEIENLSLQRGKQRTII